MTFTKVVEFRTGTTSMTLLLTLNLTFKIKSKVIDVKVIFRFLIGTPMFYTGNEKGGEFYERTRPLLLT